MASWSRNISYYAVQHDAIAAIAKAVGLTDGAPVFHYILNLACREFDELPECTRVLEFDAMLERRRELEANIERPHAKKEKAKKKSKKRVHKATAPTVHDE